MSAAADTAMASSGGEAYEQAKHVARHGAEGQRTLLAERQDAPAEILFYMAEDAAPAVRRRVAENRSTPRHADLILATDEDAGVRSGLARKIAHLLPDLDRRGRDRLRLMTVQVLETLARDQLDTVRQLVAEALQDVAAAPRQIVVDLAHDPVLAVSAPVLEHSPVLTDDDLLSVIAKGAAAGALKVIARRGDIAESVSAAIAAGPDTDAISALLANRSAQVREDTLDDLIERSEAVTELQAPLVSRERMPSRFLVKLAMFVADHLIGVLQKRSDIDEATASRLGEVVRRRIAAGGAPLPVAERDDEEPPAVEPAKAGHGQSDTFYENAQKLHEKGKLTEKALRAALDKGDNRFVIAGLAVLGDLPLSSVGQIGRSKSAKAVVALAWKAGLSAEFSVGLQGRLGPIPRHERLFPKSDGGYPLSDDDLAWQLELFIG